MKKAIVVFVALLTLGSTQARAQVTCRLGTNLAVAPGVKAPEGVVYFKAAGGLVLMSGMASTKTSEVKWVRCLLPPGTESYIGLDGLARPVVCNQPYIPVGWALPDSLFRGRKGEKGDSGPPGHDGKPGAIISGPPVRSDLYFHFDTLNVKVSGQVDIVAQATKETKVRSEGNGTPWGWIAAGTILLGGTVACALASCLDHHHDIPPKAKSDSTPTHPKDPGVVSDSSKGPGPVCTGYPCPSGMWAPETPVLLVANPPGVTPTFGVSRSSKVFDVRVGFAGNVAIYDVEKFFHLVH